MNIVGSSLAPPSAEAVAAAVADWKAADASFAAALASGMSLPRALSARGLRLCEAGEPGEAARVFHAVLAFHPDDPLAWNNLVVALDRGGAWDQAIASLEHSLALRPAQHDAWILLGNLRKTRGERGGAEAAYRTALQLDGESFLAWQCLAILREEGRDYAGAIEGFEACIRWGGDSPAIQANLGKMYYQLGRFREAAEAYARAVRGDPGNRNYPVILHKCRFLLDLIEGHTVESALAAFVGASLATESSMPTEIELLKESYALLGGYRHLEAAAAVARQWTALAPRDETAAYLLQAALAGMGGAGGERVERSPPEFIVETFDRYAERFEEQLVHVLGYDVPAKLCAALRAVAAPHRLYATLDAGCGTGLCAPFLRPVSHTLTGLDLAPKMLAQAERRHLYDNLVCEELVAFLLRMPAAFELIAAADVLIYFGDLTELFAAAAQSLAPAGLLAVSTESLADGDYQLLPTGRFAQTTAYVRAVAAPWFDECSCTPTTLRLEGTNRLAGNLFVFRRHGTIKAT